MIAFVGYQAEVYIKWIDLGNSDNIRTLLPAPKGYTGLLKDDYDWDLTFTAQRVEFRTTTEMLENRPLVMYPSSRINFLDGECNIECMLFTPEHPSTNDVAIFLAQVLNASSGEFTGRWMFAVQINGGTYNGVPIVMRGLFIVNNANITGSDTDAKTNVSGNILFGAIYAA